MDRLIYISQESAQQTHLENIRKACEAGCRWIQLRAKQGDIISLAKAAKIICDDWGAKLSINDHPAVAALTGAYGCHVGLLDMPVAEARIILGADSCLGGTANTPGDALMHMAAGADYIGYGPYRFTTTKENLSPVLGLPGYRELMEKIPAGFPVFAIGGILADDIPALLETGVYGVAVSGLITQSADAKGMVQKIYALLDDAVAVK